MVGLKEGAAFLAATCMILLLALSCAGPPKARAPQESTGEIEPQAAVPPPSASPAFDPNTVPEEVKVATIADVRAFIDSLNQIIRRQDYDAWLSNLTDEYIRHYSDPAILQQYSEYPIISYRPLLYMNFVFLALHVNSSSPQLRLSRRFEVCVDPMASSHFGQKLSSSLTASAVVGRRGFGQFGTIFAGHGEDVDGG